MIFRDRKEAGQLLAAQLSQHRARAAQLSQYRNEKPVVLALPRGGVPVAAEVAKTLNAPLDVLIVRKIGVPFSSELAAGAICEGSNPIFSEHVLSRIGLEPDDLNSIVTAEKREVERQINRFRAGSPLMPVTGRIVILVDDGLATGTTILAAVRCLRKKLPAKIIVAVPVAAASSARSLRPKTDELIVIEEREDLLSVGQWYRDFSQISDDEVISLLKQYGRERSQTKATSSTLTIELSDSKLEGDFTSPFAMKALIIFSHGSGSSRKSPRNREVARTLNAAGFGTLLFDLLTEEEAQNRQNVFNIDFLSSRLASVTQWARRKSSFRDIAIGYFGASTGAAAALQAAALLSAENNIFSIVSRGGRPDLVAENFLKKVKSPTLLIVGSQDKEVLRLNRQAHEKLPYSKLIVIPGATHLFKEEGALEEVSRQAVRWFSDCLKLKSQGEHISKMG